MDGFSEHHDAGFAEAMNLWIEITAADKQAKGLSLRSWDIRSMHEALHEALALDPSDATAYMLLEGFRAEYARNRTVGLDEMLADPDGVREFVARVARLAKLLQAPDIVATGDAFAASVRRGLQTYGPSTPGLEALVADRFKLGLLRRDALRSMKNMRVDQFLAGPPEPEGAKPVYLREVHQFLNVNSLLAAACRMPSGVSLNLIRDPDIYRSYFVFAVRNGGNLFLVGDAPEDSNPLRRFVRRRPERTLGERAARNWFPYHLLGLVQDGDGDWHLEEAQGKGLVPYQAVAVPVRPISSLEPQEFVWTAMMLDLLVRRFWHEGYSCAQLSYTGEMVRVSDALVSRASAVATAGYRPLEAAELSVADLRTGTVDQVQIGKAAGSPNAWMERRYADQVPASLLNLIGGPAEQRLLGSDAGQLALSTDAAVRTAVARDARYPLHAVDPTSFGTAEQVLADRVFIARHNLAMGVQRLADEEYARRKDEVGAWYKRAVGRNPAVLAACAEEGHWFKPIPEGAHRLEYLFSRGRGACQFYRFMSVLHVGEEDIYQAVPPQISLNRGHLDQGNKPSPKCFVDGTRASWNILFTPHDAADLAWLAGCKVAQLPDVLQNWVYQVSYDGNPILDRIDPMAWVTRDPWRAAPFCVKVSLSQRARARLQKARTGQPPFPDAISYDGITRIIEHLPGR